MPENFDDDFNKFIEDLSSNSDFGNRKSSQIVLEFLQANLPELIGGSADLSGSNNTNTKHSIDINSNDDGNYIYYGVREFWNECSHERDGFAWRINSILRHIFSIYGLWKKCGQDGSAYGH